MRVATTSGAGPDEVERVRELEARPLAAVPPRSSIERGGRWASSKSIVKRIVFISEPHVAVALLPARWRRDFSPAAPPRSAHRDYNRDPCFNRSNLFNSLNDVLRRDRRRLLHINPFPLLLNPC